jgi:putative endonuclease
MRKWSVYLIRTRFGALYTGTTTDVQRRVIEHNQGGRRGSKYLRSRGPLKLVYEVGLSDHELACKAEYLIKRLTKRKKRRSFQLG